MTADLLSRAEVVAAAAEELGIRTAIIGAMALAAHNYVRATADIDLASFADPFEELPRLVQKLESLGFRASLNALDEEDALGGVVRVWESEDDDGDPIDPIDIVNFRNPYRSGANPGEDAVRNAIRLEDHGALRYARLPELVALKLHAGNRRDQADVVEVLARNPDADSDDIREVCRRFGYEEVFEELLAEARG